MSKKVVSFENARHTELYDTEANWASVNPILSAGEIAVSKDKNKIKIGDGTSTWSELSYSGISEDEVKKIVTDNSESVYVTDDLSKLTGTYKKGDIAIVRSTFATTSDGVERNSYTAYVYDGENWCAMDGNYSAKNVFLTRDLLLTTDLGVQKLNGAATKTLPSTGVNIEDVLEMFTSKEENPKVTKPSASVYIAGSSTGTIENKAISYEAGTTVVPRYKVNFNKGAYSYEPKDTGIVPASYEVSDTNAKTATGSTGTLESFKIAAGNIYKITAKVNHPAGVVPKTNKGNPVESLKIAAGAVTATSQEITGYQQGYFIGNILLDGEGNVPAITSALIRGLSLKKNSDYAAGAVKYTVPESTACIVIACPATKTGMTQVINTTVNANMTASFVKQVVKVAGADGDTSSAYAQNYNVWTFTPAKVYASRADLTITLG